MLRSQLILENNQGQVVRTFAWEGQQLVAYHNHDTGRLEVANSEDDLKNVDFQYTVLSRSSRTRLKKEDLSVGKNGSLRLVDEVGPTVQLVTFAQDNDEEIKHISKWTTISHAAFLLLLLTISFFMGPKEETESPVVTVFHQKRNEVRPTVKMSEKKIIRPQFKAKVADRTVKPKNPVTNTA